MREAGALRGRQIRRAVKTCGRLAAALWVAPAKHEVVHRPSRQQHGDDIRNHRPDQLQGLQRRPCPLEGDQHGKRAARRMQAPEADHQPERRRHGQSHRNHRMYRQSGGEQGRNRGRQTPADHRPRLRERAVRQGEQDDDRGAHGWQEPHAALGHKMHHDASQQQAQQSSHERVPPRTRRQRRRIGDQIV